VNNQSLQKAMRMCVFESLAALHRTKNKSVAQKIEGPFAVLRPTQEFFSDMETSPLPLKGCKT
jgi:hypothetical protein